MKPGYKTTEFWMSLVVILVGAAVGSGLIPADSEWAQFASLIVSGLTALGYNAGRAFVKKQPVAKLSSWQ